MQLRTPIPYFLSKKCIHESFWNKTKEDTAESKTNRSLGSVWSKISTFHMDLVFKKVIPGPRLVYGSRPLLRPFK